MAVLKGGLQKNDLLFSLEKKYPKNFADLLAQAEGYTQVEEAFKLKDEEAKEEWQVSESNNVMEGRMKFDHARGPPSSVGEPELLLELIVKKAPIEGHDEVLPLKDFTTMSPSMLYRHRSEAREDWPRALL